MTKPRFGFNARLATAVVVLGTVAGIGFVALNRNDSSPTTTASIPARDTASNAAGEVVLHTVTPTTPRQITPVTTDSTRVKQRTTERPAPAVSRTSDSSRTTRKRTSDADSAAPPKKRVVVVDSAAEAERQFQRDSAADVADACSSADRASQHRCLLDAIDRNDRELNRVYARLISALRRQASAASADPDPDTVNDLRVEQRQWVDARDVECRDVGEGPLYARSRAACFAQQSTNRARELQRRLDAIPPES